MNQQLPFKIAITRTKILHVPQRKFRLHTTAELLDKNQNEEQQTEWAIPPLHALCDGYEDFQSQQEVATAIDKPENGDRSAVWQLANTLRLRKTKSPKCALAPMQSNGNHT